MEIVTTIEAVRAWRATAHNVAFVPTMGNLHLGHLALMSAAQKLGDAVVASIFVNRLQFGQGEDFESYPRTLEEDCEKLASAGVDVLFLPNDQELYPPHCQRFYVEPPPIQHELCGAFRPGHFRGVATVVAKLFNIVQPNIACFGKKDYQQLHIVQAMVDELNMPIMIVPVDTGRAEDGLALSSRNRYLTAEERQRAPGLYHHLVKIRERLLEGENSYSLLALRAKEDLEQHGWRVDYIEIRQSATLAPALPTESHLIVLAAARLGKTRLIDNIEVVR